jgi:ParB family protein of integrating conjugative element (PFGI_1 class)
MPARSFAAPTGKRRRTAVAELTPQDMAAKLLATGFERSGPSAATLSDPIADTPMVVTLDQLRPYDHDPRVTRNPAYAEIKASIRERGLDAPPAITRRPGEAHYIIRNGGNTRLAILRELWSETKEERFFRIACLFRPWPARGEIVALTGHLAENELRGGLTFIERALGIEKAREFYEQESGQALSQSELARRLTADGYPVPQSHISRMNDAVRYLLPAIPTLLYGGLGRHQVDRLAVLRKACERTWERRALGRTVAVDFATLVSGRADAVRHTAGRLLAAAGAGRAGRPDGRAAGGGLRHAGAGDQRQRKPPACADQRTGGTDATGSACRACCSSPAGLRASAATRLVCAARHHAGRASGASSDTACIARSAGGPARATRRAPARAHRDTGTDHRAPAVHPADGRGPARRQAARLRGRCAACDPRAGGGLYPISDVWYIEPGLDVPDRLRVHIAQFAREIAEEAAVADHIEASDGGIGFVCVAPAVGQAKALPAFARAVLTLLHALSAAPPSANGLDRARLADDLAALLHGHGGSATRLSDAALVKLFRLLRLARRLLDLEAGERARIPERRRLPHVGTAPAQPGRDRPGPA